MTDDRLRQAPVERFAPDSVVFDLADELARLRAEAAPTRHGHRQKTLYKHAGRTVALFDFEADAVLADHSAAGTVSIQTVEGELLVTAGGEPRRLPAGTMLVMAPNVRHEVRAVTAAAFVLQVSLQPA